MMDKYFQSEDFQNLIRLFENKLSIGETVFLDIDDFADLVDYYLGIDAPEMAMDCVNMGLGFYKDDPTLLKVKSSTHIYLHQFAEAVDIVSQLDESDPDVVYQLAQLNYAFYEDIELSNEFFRRWLKTNNDRESYAHIISSYVELSRPEIRDDEVVRGWIKEYIDKFSPMVDSYYDRTIADICRNQNYADLYIRIVSDILEDNPYMKHGWKMIGLAQFTGGDFESAIESLDFALAVDPEDREALLGKAHSLLALDDYLQAKMYLLQYLENGGDVVQNIPLAQCCFEMNDKEEALMRLEKLDTIITAEKAAFDANAELNANADSKDSKTKTVFDLDRYVQIYYDLGELYYAHTYFDKSIDAINKLLAVDSKHADAYFTLGCDYLMKDEFDAGLQHLSSALRYAKDRMVMCIDVVMTLMMLHYEIEIVQLIEMLDNQIAETPDSPCVKNVSAVKAMAYFIAKKEEDFYEQLEMACRDCPDFTSRVFKMHFPKGLDVADYLEYVKNNRDTFFPEN